MPNYGDKGFIRPLISEVDINFFDELLSKGVNLLESDVSDGGLSLMLLWHTLYN